MAIAQTEMIHSSAKGLDLLPPHEALRILAVAQVEAARVAETAIPEIAAAAQLAADCVAAGGQLIYAAAGSSGLMALADGLELPGTYGIPNARIKILLAGGVAGLSDMAGAPEDDVDEARAAMEGAGVKAGDCVIALTASGHTPFALTAVQVAQAAGAKTIGMANNSGAALFGLVDVAICLPTPPEVIAGSTRMGAGTAQKIALNMLSTMMAIHLGHVHDGYMVNLLADNIKLRGRAKRIVVAVTGVSEEEAAQALEAAGGRVKVAIVLAAGAEDVTQAEALLAENGGTVRGALARLGAI